MTTDPSTTRLGSMNRQVAPENVGAGRNVLMPALGSPIARRPFGRAARQLERVGEVGQEKGRGVWLPRPCSGASLAEGTAGRIDALAASDRGWLPHHQDFQMAGTGYPVVNFDPAFGSRGEPRYSEGAEVLAGHRATVGESASGGCVHVSNYSANDRVCQL